MRSVRRTAAVAFASAWLLGAAPPAELPKNDVRPPLSSADLTERAHHLFDAIVRGKPELADDFFFPREPFLELKDVADPSKYHAGLLRSYHLNVKELHDQRRSWDGATFRSFELGSPPRWVKPGEEWNRIGYYRTFSAKLRYEVSGASRTLEVHTIISWDGHWFVTHLAAVHHAG